MQTNKISEHLLRLMQKSRAKTACSYIPEQDEAIFCRHVGGGSSMDWALIQPKLAEHTCVCAYGHAGYGWSEFNPAPLECQMPLWQPD